MKELLETISGKSVTVIADGEHSHFTNKLIMALNESGTDKNVLYFTSKQHSHVERHFSENPHLDSMMKDKKLHIISHENSPHELANAFRKTVAGNHLAVVDSLSDIIAKPHISEALYQVLSDHVSNQGSTGLFIVDKNRVTSSDIAILESFTDITIDLPKGELVGLSGNQIVKKKLPE